MRSIKSQGRAACRSAVVVAWLLVLVPGVAVAQPSMPPPDKVSPAIGYAFAGLGGVEGSSTFHLGGGGERLMADAFGIGAEVGYLGPFEAAGSGVGMLSVNGAYHFLPGQPSRRLRPFVTAGYTLGFRSGHADLFNVGGGVDLWLKRTAGVRMEFRDHVYTSEGYSSHFWGFRFGVIFR